MYAGCNMQLKPKKKKKPPIHAAHIFYKTTDPGIFVSPV